MYHYKVQSIYRVIDGDTIDAVLALGFGLTATIRMRVAGIDTYEAYGANASEKGLLAAEFTRQWFEGRDAVVVRTFKGSQAAVGVGDGAFGRWLGDFYDDLTGEHLSTALALAGYDDVGD